MVSLRLTFFLLPLLAALTLVSCADDAPTIPFLNYNQVLQERLARVRLGYTRSLERKLDLPLGHLDNAVIYDPTVDSTLIRQLYNHPNAKFWEIGSLDGGRTTAFAVPFVHQVEETRERSVHFFTVAPDGKVLPLVVAVVKPGDLGAYQTNLWTLLSQKAQLNWNQLRHFWGAHF